MIKCKNNPNLEYAMYNDHPPDKREASDSYGHSKGVVAFDSSDDYGFWLIHSVPRYPPPRAKDYIFPKNINEEEEDEKLLWPRNGYPYGQTFLCVTYNRNTKNKIEKQLRYIKPCVYDHRKMAGIEDNQKGMCAKVEKVNDAVRSKQTLTSKGNVQFHHFAKSAKYNEDLYNCFIAEDLRTSLKAETWKRPSNKTMDIGCQSTYKVTDIQEINVNGFKFRSTKDHAKWAISYMGLTGNYWTCIGDINRMDKQKERGGGTACISNENIWWGFNNIILEDDKICEHRNKRRRLGNR